MITITKNMDSGCSNSPLSNQQHRNIVKRLKQIPHTEFKASHGHYYTSGFIKKDNTVVYFNSGDYRFGMGAYARYAKDVNDFTGEKNYNCQLPALDSLVSNLILTRN